MAIVRNVVRIGVITALAGGALVLIAGPQSVRAIMHQARDSVRTEINKHIDDPVALRMQLRSLEGQYPERIAAVRGDLSELNEQIAQLDRELTVSKRVVALADQDLSVMQSVLTRAEETRATGVMVKVRFADDAMDLDQGYAKANRVGQLRTAYTTRVADLERDMGYLGQQRARLSGLLEKLETERAEFQTQLWNLDRQVDAIARNNRMIEILQKRERTIDELDSPYAANSLAQLNARFADIRAKQESKLEMFAQSSDSEDYESKAKYLLDGEAGREGWKPLEQGRTEVGPSVIEIGPGDAQTSSDKGQLAARGN